MEIEVMKRFDELEKMFLKFQPRTSLQFQVDLTRHCNLNCVYCANYSPIAEEEFLSADEYEKDAKRLSELFDGEAKRIILQGGEPLLHPQIHDFLRITRECFPIGQIVIITNGIPLPSMDVAFWDACKEYRIEISPTEYPLSLDYGKLSDLTEEHGCVYLPHTFGIDRSHPKEMGKNLISLQAQGSPERNFARCGNANRCITLRHGKLYTCAQSAVVGDLKRYFHLNLPISERNGVDIYSVESGEELMRKMARAIPLCAHCDLSLQVVYEPWRVSKKDRYEWLGFEFLEEDFEYLRAASSVYVFGARGLGLETAERLKKKHINVDAILVTRKREDMTHINGIPLVKVQELNGIDEKSVCLLGLTNEKTKREVYSILREYGFKNILPIYGLNRIE